MKKIFFMMALASMVAVSCGKEDNGGATGGNGGNGDDADQVAAKMLDDFEGEAGMLTWTGVDGCTCAIVENPSKTGINTSDKVGCVTTGVGQWEFAWSTGFGGGSYEDDTVERLNFSEDGWIIKVDVYSPKANSPVYLKLESGGKGNPDKYEITNVRTTKANEWETLEFDYEPAALADDTYGNLVILFDAGIVTEGGEKFYFDNVRLCVE